MNGPCEKGPERSVGDVASSVQTLGDGTGVTRQAVILPMPQVELAPTESKVWAGGVQHIYRFGNGYAASVIQGPYSHGGRAELWEVGVFWKDNLCYDTPITDDVLGWQSDADVADLLVRIAALPVPA